MDETKDSGIKSLEKSLWGIAKLHFSLQTVPQVIMWEKECIHLCVTGSPCCTVELTEHCKPAMMEKNKNNYVILKNNKYKLNPKREWWFFI